MKKIEKILVPTDFSKPAGNAFRYALWFADHYGASIELVHVVYPEAEPLDLPVMAAQATQTRAEAAKEVIKTFVDNGIAQAIAGHNLQNVPDIVSEIRVGVPTAAVAELAERDDIDLVIMGTHGEHDAFDKTFGSVTTNTMQRLGCPVLVVPETVEHDEICTIAYATDLRKADPFHIWKACQILAPFNPILRIVHIEEKPTESTPLEMEDLENFFAERAPALQVTFHTFGAKNIVEELSEFSDAWGVDLVIMHRPKRGFFERLFHRSVSREMALFSKFPLLVMR
jgi:nucleotide-binding universal stress UspA family protein